MATVGPPKQNTGTDPLHRRDHRWSDRHRTTAGEFSENFGKSGGRVRTAAHVVRRRVTVVVVSRWSSAPAAADRDAVVGQLKIGERALVRRAAHLLPPPDGDAGDAQHLLALRPRGLLKNGGFRPRER